MVLVLIQDFQSYSYVTLFNTHYDITTTASIQKSSYLRFQLHH